MTRRLALLLCLPLLAGLSACADKAATDDVVDQSKLSDALEARASEIEEKADQAVLAADREAEAELVGLREEVKAAEETSAPAP